MKAPRILLSLLFSSLLLQAHALIPTDRKQRLTEHWEFIRQDMGSIWEVMRPITGAGKPETVPLWQKVTLPHCFKVGSINSIFYFLHKAAEPFNCLEQDNLA